MKSEIIFSGFGGQGIVAASKTLIHAGMLDSKKVSMLPSYGPEMRGGFANCHVIISEESIASPIISSPDVVVAMSAPAFSKFEDTVKEGGTLIYDSYLIQNECKRNDINILPVPATKIALDICDPKFANVVMLGVIMSTLGIPTLESMTKAINDMLPKNKQHLLELEMQALFSGMKLFSKVKI